MVELLARRPWPLWLLAAALSGCVSAPDPRLYPRWQAPELQAFIADQACRVSPDCKSFPILLVDREEPQAELLYDGHLALRRGMLEAIHDAAELSFVLAHEIAHRERGHRPVRDLQLRLPLELEADADAQRRLCELGLPADAGRRLLRRLWPATGGPPAPGSAAEQIERRIRALQGCPPGTSTMATSAEPERWQALLEQAAAAAGPAQR